MELISTRICMTKDLGICNNMFGGKVLELLDESGAAFASTIAESSSMVTLKIEEVVFKKPIKVNQLIRVYGEIDSIGNTSLTMRLEARSYNVESGIEKVVCTTKMTFVKIDSHGDSTPLSDKVKLKWKELGK